MEVSEEEPAVTSVGLSGCLVLLSLVGKLAPLLPAESLFREVVPVVFASEDRSGVA